MAREPSKPTVAPTWAEMDACIGAMKGWQHDLGVLLRFTGLRVHQAMSLKWSDRDLKNARLVVRGELGKTPQEQRGRIVPVSKHLVTQVADWDRDDTGYLVVSNRKKEHRNERMARSRDVERAWKRAGVREEAWDGRPHHAFRKGFVSELKRSGADSDAVEFLVGHSLGLRGVYIDPDALPLRGAVEKIPDLHSQPVFGALDASDPRPVREITLDHAKKTVCPSRVPTFRITQRNTVQISHFARKDGGDGRCQKYVVRASSTKRRRYGHLRRSSRQAQAGERCAATSPGQGSGVQGEVPSGTEG